MNNPAIKVVMTPSPMTVEHNDSVLKAQQIMSQRRFRHLPVLRNGELAGVLSDRDINLALVANHGMAKSDELVVEDVCTLDAFQVDLNAPLDEVVMEMGEKQIGSVLVTEGGRLAGIFTATDACKYLGKCLRGQIA
jgi:acetoin utilization protein AcuB